MLSEKGPDKAIEYRDSGDGIDNEKLFCTGTQYQVSMH
jgi:hypothetical protein